MKITFDIIDRRFIYNMQTVPLSKWSDFNESYASKNLTLNASFNNVRSEMHALQNDHEVPRKSKNLWLTGFTKLIYSNWL